jgi:hypothetical protein
LLAPPQAPIFTQVGVHPHAPDHAVEWRRVLAGEPIEIDASEGFGMKVMTINEWTTKWKVRRRACAALQLYQRARRKSEREMRRGIGEARCARACADDRSRSVRVACVCLISAALQRNDDFPDCLSCGSLRTREHHFRQEWCRGTKKWSAEALCLDCHAWSWRSYSDPAFMVGEDYEKLMWEKVTAQNAAFKAERRAALPP